MSYSEKDYEDLVHKYELLKQEFEDFKQKHAVSGNGKTAPEPAPAVATPAPEAAIIPESQRELEDTLKRLLQRVAMIIQAEKCLLLLFDREHGELFGVSPAFNIPAEDVSHVRLRATTGISGQVFQSGEPAIVADAMHDERAENDHVGLLNARSMVVVPLVVEKRDPDTGALIEKDTIGVLQVLNKMFGNEFTEEDVNLLRRLAGNTASVIHSANLLAEYRSRNKELTQTLESIQAGILVVARNGQVRLVNQAARQLFALPENITHRMYQDAITDEKVRSLIERSFATRVEQSDEVVVSRTLGEETVNNIYQAQTGLEYEDNELVGVVAIFTDITEIRNVDRMKTAFVSTVSHELRTPLTMIKGFITTLLNEANEEEAFSPEQVHEFYEIIDGECDRLTRLITDLLNVSKIEQGDEVELNPAPIDARELVNKVVGQQQATDRTSAMRVEHEWLIEVPDITFVGDPDRIEQVFINLIDNASKYSPNGGLISVKARDDGDSVLFSISDEGLGMKKEFLEKGLFSKFSRERYTDHQKIYGTGLGLYLVRHMIEAHGGRIWAHSEVGHGSTFSFRLPKRPPQK